MGWQISSINVDLTIGQVYALEASRSNCISIEGTNVQICHVDSIN